MDGTDRKYAVVIGGVNIDIGGRAFSPLVRGDSNPGECRTSMGGVGRNIAHNLCMLGVPVVFLTAFGDDHFADIVEKHCQGIGLDISHALKVPGGKTSTYLFINGPDGDMDIAMSDMSICDRITPEYLGANFELINGAAVVIMDTNIPENSIAWLCENCSAPIFADTVSVAKATKLKPFIGRLHTMKPNRIEAELLTGIRADGDESLRRIAEELTSQGLKRVFISLGADGTYAFDGECEVISHEVPETVINTTGAGDSFMAALAKCFLDGKSVEESVIFAKEAAAITTESEATVSPYMSTQLIEERLNRR